MIIIFSVSKHGLDLVKWWKHIFENRYMEANMARIEFRDNFNRLVGWRQRQGDRDCGYDNLGRFRGCYERICDQTKDANGMLYSRGDTLVALIMRR